jgi:hypothetical protein
MRNAGIELADGIQMRLAGQGVLIRLLLVSSGRCIADAAQACSLVFGGDSVLLFLELEWSTANRKSPPSAQREVGLKNRHRHRCDDPGT